MSNLWSANTPKRFWRCEPDPPEEVWRQAIATALPALDIPGAPSEPAQLAAWVLGEGQFGADHWRLSPAKRAYYRLKPVLPRALIRQMRRAYDASVIKEFALRWPLEDRYAKFLWAVMAQALRILDCDALQFAQFWPGGKHVALVLTHDIETARGQEFVRAVADLEESLGFRSSFNFVPERYAPDTRLMDDLRARGFEIGVHGLRHDGLLFSSWKTFEQRAARINDALARFGAVGFRAPLTLRHPVWMQQLAIEYDLSFFDTDPFEPIGGGTMSLWPFMLGHFVELPYTLSQDYTVTALLRETTPRHWLEKVNAIAPYYGLALVNSHPDYLCDETGYAVYEGFLRAMQARDDCWHALARDAAAWWRARAGHDGAHDSRPITYGCVRRAGDTVAIE